MQDCLKKKEIANSAYTRLAFRVLRLRPWVGMLLCAAGTARELPDAAGASVALLSMSRRAACRAG